jgi:hypothetical protein
LGETATEGLCSGDGLDVAPAEQETLVCPEPAQPEKYFCEVGKAEIVTEAGWGVRVVKQLLTVSKIPADMLQADGRRGAGIFFERKIVKKGNEATWKLCGGFAVILHTRYMKSFLVCQQK